MGAYEYSTILYSRGKEPTMFAGSKERVKRVSLAKMQGHPQL